MVSKSYMLEQKSAPLGVQVFIDQQVIPAAIDVAGAVEGLLERAAVRTRRQPATAVGAAFTLAMLLSMLTRRLPRPRFP